jgi:poly-gamma-glutamate synthesis protein (capsule biosynthesis protein)
VATLAFTGDILSHTAVFQRAALYGSVDKPYDYTPMFSQVQNLLSGADLAICHLETPISSDNSELSGYPIFNAPRELAQDLANVGYDGCSTASNHSMDKGVIGVFSTLNQLELAGLKWAGMARTPKEKEFPTYYVVNDIVIAHLSYTYGLNGFTLPEQFPYLVDEIDMLGILQEAREARSFGAEFIVVSLQWGNEYQSDPSPEQEELANGLLTDPDIDLIVGSHVHVVQPIGTINQKPVIYGLGNFLSNQSANCCPEETQNGVIAFVEIAGLKGQTHQVQKISITPTRVDRSDFTIIALPSEVQNLEISSYVRNLYATAIEKTRSVINMLHNRYPIRANNQ